jgi:lysozyme
VFKTTGAQRRLRWLALAAALGGVAAVAAYVLFSHGYLHIARPSRAEFPVRGVDVSHHQGRIDWRRVHGQGYAFAYIKASEGATLLDSAYARNRDQARQAGMVTGPYHYFTLCTPGDAQARNFLAAQPGDAGPSLPPALDIEFGGNCAARPPRDSVLAEIGRFLAISDSAFGRRTVLYVTPEFHRAYMRGATDRPVWARDIFRRPRYAREWLFWQYAANGRVDGVGGLIDLNAFHGTRAEFDALVRGGTPPPPR